MNILDSIDKQLIILMGQNARQSSETLAKKLNLSAATVRRRINRLINIDSLRIVGIADPTEFGFSLGVVINLDVEQTKLESIMEWLINRTEIKWAAISTGRFDIIAIGGFTSTGHLSNFLTKELTSLEGIKDTETLISLDVRKGRYTSLF
jgi:Lrp/AsnC family transcriptional regulator, regulator for asnA, asnC and gidA